MSTFWWGVVVSTVLNGIIILVGLRSVRKAKRKADIAESHCLRSELRLYNDVLKEGKLHPDANWDAWAQKMLLCDLKELEVKASVLRTKIKKMGEEDY